MVWSQDWLGILDHEALTTIRSFAGCAVRSDGGEYIRSGNYLPSVPSGMGRGSAT
jgi:hypothetical protein